MEIRCLGSIYDRLDLNQKMRRINMQRIFTINNEEVSIQECTVVFLEFPNEGRQEALFIHQISDKFGNGDGVIGNCCTLPESDEEAAAILQNEFLDTDSETLKTIRIKNSLNPREFYKYILANFELNRAARTLVWNAIHYVALQGVSLDEQFQMLCFLLDGIGLEEDEIAQADFTLPDD